jgi:hypothetical protein
LAGIPRVGAQALDGKDLSPLLFGSIAQWPERMIFSHQNGRVSARTQQYRFLDNGTLFDMTGDPGQAKDIADQKPELAASLTTAIADWRKDVFGATTRAAAKDSRPFPVGYPEFPRTPLPARDGLPHGGIKRSGSAPNSSYFVNWHGLPDTVTWDVEVNASGNYGVEILYTCPVADAGSTIELSFNQSRLSGNLNRSGIPRTE